MNQKQRETIQRFLDRVGDIFDEAPGGTAHVDMDLYYKARAALREEEQTDPSKCEKCGGSIMLIDGMRHCPVCNKPKEIHKRDVFDWIDGWYGRLQHAHGQLTDEALTFDVAAQCGRLLVAKVAIENALYGRDD